MPELPEVETVRRGLLKIAEGLESIWLPRRLCRRAQMAEGNRHALCLP